MKTISDFHKINYIFSKYKACYFSLKVLQNIIKTILK